MDSTIILIGPICAGKSVIAELLAKELHLSRYSLDDERWKYYHEIGYNEAEASRLAKSDEGMPALLRYWKPFEAHSVERILADHSGSVIDFGAGHSFYEDDALFSRVQAALAPYPYVFLLLPSPDPNESVRVLNERFAQLLAEEMGDVDQRLLDMNEQFIRHPSNYRLAKKIIYTNGKTPAETCAEIVGELGNE